MNSIDTQLLDQLKELIGGDQDTLNDLISTFTEEADDIIKSMQSALETKDLDVLRRAAHSLKSSSQDFGAVELSTLSASLESQCRSEWPDDDQEQVSKIATSFASAKAELLSYVSQS